MHVDGTLMTLLWPPAASVLASNDRHNSHPLHEGCCGSVCSAGVAKLVTCGKVCKCTTVAELGVSCACTCTHFGVL